MAIQQTNSSGKLRFSLATVLVATAVCAIACAVAIMALRTGNWRWARIVFTLFVVATLSASVCGLYRQGARRAFCIGFATFGWVYLLFTVCSSFQVAERFLIGREIIAMLADYSPEASSGLVVDSSGSRISVFSFHQIVHSFVGIAFGLLGGIIGSYCYWTRGNDSN